MTHNPYPLGINWASSLEVAFRCMAWLWTYNLTRGSSDIPEFHREWLRSLALHGRHIERYLSTYFSPNTHLLGEAVGLFFLGVLCPEISSAPRWKSLGWKLILQESERQVGRDGFHFERSTYYHVYALDLFLHAQVLASFNGIRVPQGFRDKVEKMLVALSLLGRHGPPPRFGDDDGGRLFDPHRNRSEHLLDPLATGAILFQRGDFRAAAGDLREETLWLLGEEGVRQWDRLQPNPVEHESRALPEAGFYLLTAQNSQLIIDAGPLGALTGGHGHSDALSICLQSCGRSLLIDPGTVQYAGPGLQRDLFRGTAMHNTLRIDGLDQAGPATIFSWKKLTKTKVERWIQGHGFDLLVASHDGYETLEQPVTHRRCVISLKNGMYLVRDVIEGSGTRQIDIAWHLGQDVELVGETVFRVKGTPCALAFLPAEKEGWTEEVLRGSWSPAYGQKAPMSVLNFSAHLELPAEFAILLIASNAAIRSHESLCRPVCTVAGVSAYEYFINGRRYSFAFHDQGGVWQNGPVSSDAEFVCHEVSPLVSKRLILCNGTYARIDGTELRCSRTVESAELELHESRRQVFSSDPSAIIEQSCAESFRDPASVFSD
jgi:Heparinase II/III-like protein/Heparinase II/III N-terminus